MKKWDMMNCIISIQLARALTQCNFLATLHNNTTPLRLNSLPANYSIVSHSTNLSCHSVGMPSSP
jgi:hypothetical protein